MKKIIFVVVVIVFLITAHNMIQNTISLWQKQHIVKETEEELERVKEENKELTSKLEAVSQPGFVEAEARDKLFYVKPGEQIVFITQEKQDESEEIEETVSTPSWKQWLDLFFDTKEV